jgi:hypothetical protein
VAKVAEVAKVVERRVGWPWKSSGATRYGLRDRATVHDCGWQRLDAKDVSGEFTVWLLDVTGDHISVIS